MLCISYDCASCRFEISQCVLHINVFLLYRVPGIRLPRRMKVRHLRVYLCVTVFLCYTDLSFSVHGVMVKGLL